jgi:hypothetical protein
MTQTMQVPSRALPALTCRAIAAYGFGSPDGVSPTLRGLALGGGLVGLLRPVRRFPRAVTRAATCPPLVLGVRSGASPALSCQEESHPAAVAPLVSGPPHHLTSGNGDPRGLTSTPRPKAVCEDHQYGQPCTDLEWSATTRAIGLFLRRPHLRLDLLAHLLEGSSPSMPRFFPMYLQGLTSSGYLGIALAGGRRSMRWGCILLEVITVPLVVWLQSRGVARRGEYDVSSYLGRVRHTA